MVESSPRADINDPALRDSVAALSQLAMGIGSLGLTDVLRRVAELTVDAIEAADGAGLTLVEAGRADTIVATTGFVREVDAIQYGLGEGPILAATHAGVTLRAGSLEQSATWPGLARRVAPLGVHSMLSVPLIVDERVLGAINVYAFARDAFDDRAVELAELFALPAAIYVANAQTLFQAQRLVSELQAALATGPERAGELS